MQTAFWDMDNVHIIADDILICGYAQTRKAANQDHNRTMNTFLKRCTERRINLNADDFVYKVSQIPFMSHLFTDAGILSDSSRVHAITDMPIPKDVAGVCRLCGCINYLSKFIPHLADLARPLHDLTRKGTAFTWEPHHAEAVNKLKATISFAPVLAWCLGSYTAVLGREVQEIEPSH